MNDSASPGGGDSVAPSAGYEALRVAVLSGRADGWRHGHGVLAREGMAGWMAAWAAVAPASAGTTAPQLSDPSTPPCSHPQTAPLSSLRGAGEIVAVLAQMALDNL